MGVDGEGRKHLLGLAEGAIENAQVVKDLLQGLAKRGLDPEQAYVFVIDGSKALCSALEEIFGPRAIVPCFSHLTATEEPFK